VRRGYSLKFTRKFTSKIFEQRPQTLVKKTETGRTRFVARYSPATLKAIQVIRKYWPHIKKSPTVYPKLRKPPLLALKSNHNLHSYLRLPPTSDTTTLELTTLNLETKDHTPGKGTSKQTTCSCFLHKILDNSQLLPAQSLIGPI